MCMFKRRLRKLNSAALILSFVFLSGGLLTSCEDILDDYPQDNTRPPWLGESIYDFLKTGTDGSTYNVTTSIIDSLDYANVLAQTGSKTLFVADDSAYMRFFENNRWGVKSVDDLSIAQMRILLFGSMLDNAYLLDMMSSLPGNPPIESSCLLRTTSLQGVDSIPYFASGLTNGCGIPRNNSYWNKFRAEKGGDGLLLALDGTDPMMVHFLREYVKSKDITSEDVNILFNTPSAPRTGNEAFIYQNQILPSGITYDEYSDDSLTITCKNGYVYKMDGVLLPPSNMAQELREHPKTKIFSYLVDRFSVPVYNSSLSSEYNRINGTNDSVFVLRYLNYSENYPLDDVANNISVKTTIDNEAELLKFDPGWNHIVNGSTNVLSDMAAIYVPNDEHMFKFFGPKGPGEFLVELYAAPEAIAKIDSSNPLSILDALDYIPNQIIASFVNNLMRPSFVGSVPSKFHLVQNDSFEELGIKSKDVEECVVANNGVIYVLNNVFGPDEFEAVSAPPLYMKNMAIMKQLIDKLGYGPYLLAMDATYTLLVPDDEYFVYYDPVSIETGAPTAYKFYYDNKSGVMVNDTVPAVKLWAKRYLYNPQTFELGDTLENYAIEGRSVNTKYNEYTAATNFKWDTESSASPENFLSNRLKDLMEYLIIIGDVETSPNKYHSSKGYGTIKCEVNNTNTDNLDVKFYGGLNLEKGTAVKVTERYDQENGITYCTVSESENDMESGIPAPPTKSVYHKMHPDSSKVDDFRNFFNLCVGTAYESDGLTPMATIESMLGIIYPDFSKEDTKLSKIDSINKYSIFTSLNSSSTGRYIPRDFAVPFFNTYHYTVYVPTNDALQKAYEKGLPTWEEIYTELVDTLDGTDKRAKALSYISLLNNFARYHFQDNSLYVDNVINSGTYETSAINYESDRFYEVDVTGVGSGSNATIEITDNMNNTARVVTTAGEEGQSWNAMARDMLFFCRTAGNMINTSKFAIYLETASYAVLHQIDNILENKGLFGYDGNYKRFANDGELVDSMAVTGLTGSLDNGKYLVANCGTILEENSDGSYSYKKIGYLMKKTSSSDKMDMEEYVYSKRNEKILIDNDGYWRKKVVSDEGKSVTYTYLYVDENGNESETPAAKVDNNGNII